MPLRLLARYTFNLVEFCKMCTVDGLIAEHPVDAEVLGRLETLLRQLVEHSRGDCGRMCAEEILLCFAFLPRAAVSAQVMLQSVCLFVALLHQSPGLWQQQRLLFLLRPTATFIT